MPAKKTTAKKQLTPSEQADEFYAQAAEEATEAAAEGRSVFADPYDEAFYAAQPCTVAEFAIAAKKPMSQCRVWLAEQAANGRVKRDGDLRWHYS